jgi:7-keto-8-aminopelargonate synthetase-like enzyme
MTAAADPDITGPDPPWAVDGYDRGERNLLDRWMPVHAAVSRLGDAGAEAAAMVALSPVASKMRLLDRTGRYVSGVNFAVPDALSLGRHPAVVDAVRAAALSTGVLAGGIGLSVQSVSLECTLAGFLGTRDAIAFPSGIAAFYGMIRALIRPGDQVLIDASAGLRFRDSLQVARAGVTEFRQDDPDDLADRLRALRSASPGSGILVVVDALPGHTAQPADILSLAAACRAEGAILALDVSRDLGALGPGGRGLAEAQGALDQVDLYFGSLAHAFAGSGGFVASDHPAVKTALRTYPGPQVVSVGMPALQAAASVAAIGVVDGPEGSARRARLIGNALRLRNGLTDAGFEVPGQPGPVVPVRLPAGMDPKEITARMIAAGEIVSLVEPGGGLPPVWPLHVMADHRADEIEQFVRQAVQAREG